MIFLDLGLSWTRIRPTLSPIGSSYRAMVNDASCGMGPVPFKGHEGPFQHLGCNLYHWKRSAKTITLLTRGLKINCCNTLGSGHWTHPEPQWLKLQGYGK